MSRLRCRTLAISIVAGPVEAQTVRRGAPGLRPWRSRSHSCSGGNWCSGRSRQSIGAPRRQYAAQIAPVPGQVLTALSTAKDKGVESFWLSHD